MRKAFALYTGDGPVAPSSNCERTVKMAGTYVPKSGPYAGQKFASRRQYLNRQAQDQGFTSYSQKSKVKKLERDTEEIRNSLDVSYRDTKTLRGDKVIDVYSSPFLDDIFTYIKTLYGSQTIRIILDVDIMNDKYGKNTVTRRFITLENRTRVSLMKKEIDTDAFNNAIDNALRDVLGIHDVILWVYRS